MTSGKHKNNSKSFIEDYDKKRRYYSLLVACYNYSVLNKVKKTFL